MPFLSRPSTWALIFCTIGAIGTANALLFIGGLAACIGLRTAEPR